MPGVPWRHLLLGVSVAADGKFVLEAPLGVDGELTCWTSHAKVSQRLPALTPAGQTVALTLVAAPP